MDFHTHMARIFEVSLLFIGDIMQHMPPVEGCRELSRSAYIYDSASGMLSCLESYDFAHSYLETTLAGMPYSGYPAISSPTNW
jgi:poly-gamma-glutamate synthesis protein (capsule biosynthesis protein)